MVIRGWGPMGAEGGAGLVGRLMGVGSHLTLCLLHENLDTSCNCIAQDV